MIDLPKVYSSSVTSPSSSNNAVRFHPIADEEKDNVIIERRLSPTRRKPRNARQAVERRVSSDRRRSTFNRSA